MADKIVIQDTKKKAKRITFGLLLAIALFLITIFIFWRITDEIVIEKEGTFDQSVYNVLTQYTNPATTHTMLVFTFFGSTKFLLPGYILLAGFFLFYKRNRWQSISVAAIGASSIGLLFLLKNIFQRHRPLEPLTKNVMGYSYPSGHSFSSFTFFGLLAYIIWQTNIPKIWKWILSFCFIFFAGCIALSRVYLHVHYASDVVAGFCLSIIWLTIAFWIFQKMKSTNRFQGL